MGEIPNSAKQRFGLELRNFREHTGLTQKQLAKAVPMSQSHVSSIESGTRGTNEQQIARIDQALGAGGSLVIRWRGLLRQGGFPSWFSDVAELEAQASEIFDYDPLVIPGLLQHPDYAQELITIGRPYDDISEIKRQTHIRIQRQEVLEAESPPRYQAVLDELWLRRTIGSPAIMRRQLDQLAQTATKPRVSIQVIPAETLRHPGLDGAFRLLTVPERGTVAYAETRRMAYSTSDPDAVEDYKRVSSDLRAAALPEAASLTLLRTIRDEFQ
jgi:transcriptional regulator with XRE-family HTH domain